MDEKKFKFRKLLLSYLFILVVTIVLVAPTHLFSQPLFMPMRFPHYLEMMPTFLGFSWPATFEIYHWTLLIIGAIGVINILGLFFSNMKLIARMSSLIGLFLFPLMVLFFFFIFSKVNLSTAIIYGLFSLELLKVDFLTFKALVKRTEEVPEAS